MSDTEGALPEGEILKERFKIKSVIGTGAYGVVYLAEDLTLQGLLWAIAEEANDGDPGIVEGPGFVVIGGVKLDRK